MEPITGAVAVGRRQEIIDAFEKSPAGTANQRGWARLEHSSRQCGHLVRTATEAECRNAGDIARIPNGAGPKCAGVQAFEA